MPQTVPKQLTELEKVWLACAIDSEGSIDFYPHSKGPGGVISIIRISNTNLGFLTKAQTITELGRISERVANRLGRFGRKPIWDWEISGLQNSGWLLEQILPYLIIKTEKAKRVIELAKFRAIKGHRPYGIYERTILGGDIMQIEEIKRLL